MRRTKRDSYLSLQSDLISLARFTKGLPKHQSPRLPRFSSPILGNNFYLTTYTILGTGHQRMPTLASAEFPMPLSSDEVGGRF